MHDTTYTMANTANESMASASSPSQSFIADRLARVRASVRETAMRAGRAPEDVRLIAVSKTHPATLLQLAIDAGACDFGENRVQEAVEKIKELGRSDCLRWHLIGNLQANKARRAVQNFDVIHSLDDAELARRLNRMCEEENRAKLPVLVQVDLGGEATKSGVSENDLPELIEVIKACEHLSLIGLMTLPPFFDDAEPVRPFFRRLREVRDRLRSGGAFGDNQGELSMGMSHDYEVAIEEGATMVRIGTAIFGTRNRK